MSAKQSREKMMLKRNKKRLRTELRIIYDELLNQAEGEMEDEFDRGLQRGELIEFFAGPDNNDLQDFLVAAVDTYFGIESEGRDALPGA